MQDAHDIVLEEGVDEVEVSAENDYLKKLKGHLVRKLLHYLKDLNYLVLRHLVLRTPRVGLH